MKHDVTISVVIPCYNNAGQIEEALGSVYSQTRLPDEVIVIDDGSTDGSRDLVRRFPEDIRLLCTNSANAARARNKGISKATGTWIAFLDADDLWYSNHLERLEEIISLDPKSVGVLNHHDINIAGSDETVSQSRKIEYDVETCGLTPKDYLVSHANSLAFTGMSACSVKRSRAVQIGGMREDFTRRHDIEFWLRLIYQHNWCWNPIATSVYRKYREGSLSDDTAEARLMHLKAFLQNEQYSDLGAYQNAVDRIGYKAAKGLIKYAESTVFRQEWPFVFRQLSWYRKIQVLSLVPTRLLFKVIS